MSEESKTISKENSSTSFLEHTKDMVDITGKIALGIIAIFYVIGVIVVNIYLSNFGVYSPSLLRLNYIAAGIWTMVPILSVALMALLLLGLILQLSSTVRKLLTDRLNIKVAGSEDNKWLTWGSAIVMALVFFLGLALFRATMGVAGFYGSLFEGEMLKITLTSAGYIFLIVPLMIFVTPHIVSRAVKLFFSFFIAGFFLYSYSYEFAKNVYGTIPSYLGGGQPKEVQLVIDSDENKRKFFQDLGIQFLTESSNVTVNVKLLLVTEDEYVLLVEKTKCCDGKTVQTGLTIQRDKIQAILYEGANFRGGGSSGSSY